MWLCSVEANINLMTFHSMYAVWLHNAYSSVCVSISDMSVPTSVYESCLKRKFSGWKFDERKFGKQKFIERKCREVIRLLLNIAYIVCWHHPYIESLPTL